MRAWSGRSSALVLTVLVALTASLGCDSTRPAVSVTGTWEGEFASNTPNDSISIRLTQSDSTLYGGGYLRIGSKSANTGPVYPTFQVEGTVSGGTVNLVISQGPVTTPLRGRVVGDQMPVVFDFFGLGTYPIVLHRVSNQGYPSPRA